ncbi:TlpA disulfide reductase family protein [Leptobacterium sp. I13]|uniref:TlpA disulfide reductase family protein n=1 Tax=Leptobacterium meishanense TaxID=3128904 RepID=UPI0030EC7CC3
MKKILTYIFVVFVLASCDKALNGNEFVVNVSIEGIEDGSKVILRKADANYQPIDIDSTEVLNEQFSLRGDAKIADMYHIVIDGLQGSLSFVTEPGEITVTAYKDSIFSSIITGTPSNDDYYAYVTSSAKNRKRINNLIAEYRQAAQENNTPLTNDIARKINKVRNDIRNYDLTFVKEHPDSYMAPLLIEQMLQSKSQPISVIQDIYTPISERIKSTTLGQKINNIIENAAKVAIGAIAPDFSAPTPSGELLALNDAKGTVTIVDFWAAWCKPCRIENPNLVKIYDAYKGKGLNIVSVSLDKTMDHWKKAIEEDQLPWDHVSNLKYWQDPIAKLYNVNAIPASFILDSEGKIVAKDLRGSQLEAKIAELLAP